MHYLMRRINQISRCATLYKTERLGAELSGCYLPFVSCIANEPGLSQDAIAHRLCVNKSTVTRALTYLEAEGFVRRESDDADKRVLRIYPTEKMLEILPRVRKINREWNQGITADVSEEEMAVFEAVLSRMVIAARSLAGLEERE